MCSTWRFRSSSIRVLLGKIPCLRPNRGCWFGFFPPIPEPWSHRIQNLPGATVTPGPAQPPAPSPSSWIPQFPPHHPPPAAAAGWSPQGRTNPCLNPGRNCSAQGLWLQTITHWQLPPGDSCPFSPSLALNPRISFFSPNISCWLFFFLFFFPSSFQEKLHLLLQSQSYIHTPRKSCIFEHSKKYQPWSVVKNIYHVSRVTNIWKI